MREVRLDIEGFPEIEALRDEVVRLRAQTIASSGLGGSMVGTSAPMRDLAWRVGRVAQSEVPVLIHGETGTGKELVARAIHDASPRARGPFVAENCGAFSDGVLQSELFGHERGAFTDASHSRRGLFEMAHGGTLFLDEVGELPARVQVNLLRVLQEGTLRPVGGERTVRVDVRVIAATHRDLPAMVAAGTFREDLYYRLRGATIAVPALRERSGDLEPLVAQFLREAGRTGEAGRAAPLPTRAAWRLLSSYRWPGNVRELRAEVLRWTVFADAVVRQSDLAPEIRGDGSSSVFATPTHANRSPAKLAEVVADAEDRAIEAAMERHGGNISRAARELGIDRNTLKRKRRRLSASP